MYDLREGGVIYHERPVFLIDTSAQLGPLLSYLVELPGGPEPVCIFIIY